MADNVNITAGSGTIVATDEVTINSIAAQVQRIKVGVGADGTYSGDVSPTLPFPVGRGQQVNPTVVISSGTSLSASSGDLGQGRLVGILMPAGWDAATLSFQGSIDGTTYGEIFSDAGVAASMVVAASQLIQVQNAAFWLAARYIKVRSGTSATAVNQTANRTLTLITQA